MDKEINVNLTLNDLSNLSLACGYLEGYTADGDQEKQVLREIQLKLMSIREKILVSLEKDTKK